MYHGEMAEKDPLDAYLQICLELYHDLLREGRWPWPDSTDHDDLVESEDN